MSRLGTKDILVIGVFLLGALVVAVLAIIGLTGWALAVFALLGVVYVAVGRIDVQAQRAAVSGTRDRVRDVQRKLDVLLNDQKLVLRRLRRVEESASASEVAAKKSSKAFDDVRRLRPEIRGLRVAQQLMAQSIDATKSRVDDVQSALAGAPQGKAATK